MSVSIKLLICLQLLLSQNLEKVERKEKGGKTEESEEDEETDFFYGLG